MVATRRTHRNTSMHRTNAFALIVASLAAAFACTSTNAADTLNARPGAWEMTSTVTLQGITIPPDEMATIPADQRAAMEKMLADRVGKPTTSTRKTCVRKEDLAQDPFMRNKERNCTTDITARTTTRLAATQTCQGPPSSKGTVVFEAKSPESVVGTIDQQRGDGVKLHVNVAGKWLADSCEGTEPLMRKMP